ncbi:YihY/virulence factor BrkB family protein [Agromyces lapidis]|uniref:YihY/virulence factor BrkB family protein n=1 Tax=Agromyces lapidis TaxID=279574 RepID=A0ABV5SUS8_9MICO|nr:YihY/virulence factor BrkB family protein [Agromyces lapidis]
MARGIGSFWQALVRRGERVWKWALRLVPVQAIVRYFTLHGPMLADSVTYRALFSVFAGVFLGFAVAGVWLAGRPEAIEALVEALDSVIPGLVGENALIHPDQLLQPLTLSVAGVLALVGLVGAAIGAIGSLRVAFRDLAEQPDDPRFFGWLMFRDFVFAIGFGAAFVISAVMMVASTAALGTVFDWLGVSTRSPWFDALTRTVSVMLAFAIDSCAIAALFRLLSGIRVRARSLWRGAVIGGLGLTGLQVLSGLFVGGAMANPLLASFAALIALLIWLNLSSQVILIAGAYIVADHRAVAARASGS